MSAQSSAAVSEGRNPANAQMATYGTISDAHFSNSVDTSSGVRIVTSPSGRRLILMSAAGLIRLYPRLRPNSRKVLRFRRYDSRDTEPMSRLRIQCSISAAVTSHVSRLSCPATKRPILLRKSAMYLRLALSCSLMARNSVNKESRQSDSNRRPADYKSAALPTELCRHLRGKILHVHSLFSAIVSPFCIPQTKTGTTCGFRSAAVGALSAFPPKRQAHSSG